MMIEAAMIAWVDVHYRIDEAVTAQRWHSLLAATPLRSSSASREPLHPQRPMFPAHSILARNALHH